LPVSVFGVPNTGIPVSVYTGLENTNWDQFHLTKTLAYLHKYILGP
jgi:hypothetical protein